MKIISVQWVSKTLTKKKSSWIHAKSICFSTKEMLVSWFSCRYVYIYCTKLSVSKLCDFVVICVSLALDYYKNLRLMLELFLELWKTGMMDTRTCKMSINTHWIFSFFFFVFHEKMIFLKYESIYHVWYFQFDHYYVQPGITIKNIVLNTKENGVFFTFFL